MPKSVLKPVLMTAGSRTATHPDACPGEAPAITVGREMPTLHVVLAPNAFKGTLTSLDAARAMAAGVGTTRASTRLLPIADGGDGSVDAFLGAGYLAVEATVRDALGRPHRATIAVKADEAVVETANTCGLALLGSEPRQPLDTCTLGLGDAMRSALDTGATRIAICLGGSASTDGGAGMLVALGARLLDSLGREVEPSGRHLAQVHSLDVTGLDPRLAGCALTVLVDVSNPLHGRNGAAHVFAGQKGATPQEILLLDDGLATWARVLREATGLDTAALAGAGAAGGTAAAAAALGATIQRGGHAIPELLGLEQAVAVSDLVITGEGCLDEQTLHGKGISHVIEVARGANVPVLAVCGRIDLSPAVLGELGLAGWSESGRYAGDEAQALTQATADAVETWLTASGTHAG